MARLLQLRRGTAAQWTSANPVLANGEPGFETDTGFMKVGDGATAWTSLAYWRGGGGAAPLGALTPAANKLPYYTGASSAALADLSAYMRGLLGSADEAALKAAINAEAGTDFQAQDAYLQDIADASLSSGDVFQFDGVNVVGAQLPFDRLPFAYYFGSSGTLTFPNESNAFIVAIGAGGSGASVIRGGARAQGGGSGAVAIKNGVIAASTALTVTIGAGGAGVSSPGSFVTTNGNAGGATTVVGGTINISAGGGAGGVGSDGVTVSKQTAAVATGGDFNFEGGQAGELTSTGSTGGAAPNPFGAGHDSGDVSISGRATGGASPAAASTNDAITAAAGFADISTLWGCVDVTATNGGAGSVATGISGSAGEKFAGGGGHTLLSNSSGSSGAGGIGAGSGGMARTVSGGLTSSSAAGGNGAVLILTSKPATRS